MAELIDDLRAEVAKEARVSQPMDRELDGLSSEVDSLTSDLHELRDRLAPVLTKRDDARPGYVREDSAGSSDHVQTVSRVRDRLVTTREMIAALMSDLEV